MTTRRAAARNLLPVLVEVVVQARQPWEVEKELENPMTMVCSKECQRTLVLELTNEVDQRTLILELAKEVDRGA